LVPGWLKGGEKFEVAHGFINRDFIDYPNGLYYYSAKFKEEPMKFEMKKEDLFRGLQKAQGVVTLKGAMPILSNILLETREDEISITATDLDIGMEGQYPATVTTPGKLTINAKKIFDIVRELPEKVVRAETDEKDWLNLTCGKSKFKIAGLPPEDFPKLPSFPEGEYSSYVDKNILRDMIRGTVYAASIDTARRNLNGALLELEGREIRMVGTDGHRLAFVRHETGESAGETTKSVILPKKALLEIVKFIEDDAEPLSFYIGENHASFKKKKFHLVSRLVDDQFPLYRQVIPTDNTCKAVLNRNDFQHALKRVSIMAEDTSRQVRLEFGRGQLKFQAKNADIGEAAEEIEADYSADAVAIGLNADYVLDILANISSERVNVFLKDSKCSCLITPDNDEHYKCIVMPMRLD